MSEDTPEKSTISRRSAFGLLGATAAAGAAGPLLLGGPADAHTAPAIPGLAGLTTGSSTTPVQGLHLTFGADPASQMVVSWLTDAEVKNPRVVYGSLSGGLGRTVNATTKTYVDGISQRTVWVHHATLSGLSANSDYIYAAQHDGATPDAGTFQTAPRGRAPFTFTSFGDQATPSVTWAAGATNATNGTDVALNANTTASASDVVIGVEKVAPLFHLLNGDLCYANLDPDRVRIWNEFFTNNTRSARFRPWMPAAGNHEIELSNGAVGLDAYQTYFQLPSPKGDKEFENLWYSFTVGGVHVVVLQNDDNCLQDGGDLYIKGYSDGAQVAWLKADLAAARNSSDIDWIVVCMHQVMISSSIGGNGSDINLRAVYGPIFDEYGVDLVVCGHEHDYERSLAVKGVVSGSTTLTPNPASTKTDVIDSELGTVHMVLGGGGVSGTTNQTFSTLENSTHIPAGSDFPEGKVIYAYSGSARTSSNPTAKGTTTFEYEPAVWIGNRDVEHPYGFAAFDVDPGRYPGDTTKINVTYYNVNKPYGQLSVFEQFTLQRRRSDGRSNPHR